VIVAIPSSKDGLVVLNALVKADLELGKSIYSTQELDLDNYNYLTLNQLTQELDNIYNASIVVSAYDVYKRRGQKIENKLFTHVIVTSRMRDLVLYITVKELKDLDPRLRRNVDILVDILKSSKESVEALVEQRYTGATRTILVTRSKLGITDERANTRDSK